jgi:hypothetical protein
VGESPARESVANADRFAIMLTRSNVSVFILRNQAWKIEDPEEQVARC